MIVRTYRPKHLIRMIVIALGLTAACSPVVASQETKKEADLSCSSSDAASPCPSAAARKDTPEPQGRRPPTLACIPEPQAQSHPQSPPPRPQDATSALLSTPV